MKRRKHEFGPTEMLRWLEKFRDSQAVRERPSGLQRLFDQLAICCLDANELALGVAVVWLFAARIAGKEGKALARLGEVLAELDGQRCRVCGCTEFDCRQCVERTGEPCFWVEPDLCSACVGRG